MWPGPSASTLLRSSYRDGRVSDTARRRSRTIESEVHMEVNSIDVDGSRNDSRYLVRINGWPIYLAPAVFKVFAMLAVACKRRMKTSNGTGEGWLRKARIHYEPDRVAAYLNRMKGDIHAACAALLPWPVYQSDRAGHYRLLVDPEKVTLNRANLVAFGDAELTRIVGGGHRDG